MRTHQMILAAWLGACSAGGAMPAAAQDAVPAPDGAETALAVDARAALSAMTVLVEQHIRSMTSALELAAATAEVRSGDWDRMKPLLAEVQQKGVPAAVWFARTDGSYCSVDMGPTSQNLSDRAYFSKVVGGEICIASPVVSRSTGKKSVVTAVPIHDGEKVVGMLGASIFLEKLSQLIKEELDLPADMLFFALDPAGVTMINWHPERVFLDPSQQGSESMAEATRQMLASRRGEVEYTFNDRRRRVVFETGPVTGWRFALGVIED